MESSVHKELTPVSTQRLELGMFVADLDCPWSETPFRFQGFEILSRSEIELLQKYCTTVFIDPHFVSTVTLSRESMLDFSTTDSTEVVESKRLALREMLTDADLHVYAKAPSQRVDFAAAQSVYEHALEQRKKLLSALRAKKPVRAAHCRGVVESIAVRATDDPDAMIRAAMLSKRSDRTTDRSVSTAVWCAVFARYLELPPKMLVDLAVGGLLLDIGMQKLAPSLLDETTSYGKRQQLAMQAHVALGREMLEGISDLPHICTEMVVQHHIRPQGGGYPLAGGEDPRSAAGILAGVVDQFDAMITGNSRRPPMAPSEALGTVSLAAESSPLDTLIADQFVQAIGRFPSGSIVELNSGEVGVVSVSDPDRRLRPTLHVVTKADKTPTSVREVALKSYQRDPSKAKALWIVRGHPPGAFGIEPRTLFD
ncbi:MAG: DUF3391 domain-containing protein [Pseudomonadota bacterium]